MACHFTFANGATRNQRHRRADALCFVEHHLHIGQFFLILPQQAVQIDGVDLLHQLLFHVGIARQIVDGVGDGSGGGVVCGKHQEDGLIGHFLGAEVFAELVFLAAEET